MTAQIIDGLKIAHSLKEEAAADHRRLLADGLQCTLATVAVGDNFGAHVYQRRITRLSAELGVPCRPLTLPATTTQDKLLTVVRELNDDPDITGILLLRPLPAHLDEAAFSAALCPWKDIEAVHPENQGLLAAGTPRYVPSTAASVYHLLDTWVDGEGEERADFYHHASIVIIGRSNNVGKPAVSLAQARQAVVTSVDEWASRTGRLGRHTRGADVLIVAAGVAGLIRAEHVRAGAIVIDVGINSRPDPATGKVHTVGDVAFDEVRERARALTPVPGGVGPVTDVWVVHNTITAARIIAGRR
jgi:methylenetetrahydrofolate dehydrogenase (NADP+)/methenyltetrahydrofolate cyclohydrolase